MSVSALTDFASNHQTRRELFRHGVALAAVPSLFTPRSASADIAPDGDVKSTIYLFASDVAEPDVRPIQGVFAVDAQSHTWSRVVDQSESNVMDTLFRVSHNGRFLAFPRYPQGAQPAPDGVLVRDLTRGGAICKVLELGGNALWSPDDKQLLIDVAKPDPATGFSVMESLLIDIDGAKPQKLPIPATDQVGDWSPDGSWVVTTSYRDKGVGYQLYRMRLDGTDAHRLTTTGSGVSNLYPRIAPNGRQIVYYRAGDRQAGLWMMNADGSDSRQIFQQRIDATPDYTAWSPDSKRIAATVTTLKRDKDRDVETGDPRLMILDVAGGAPTTLTRPRTAVLGAPQWAVQWQR